MKMYVDGKEITLQHFKHKTKRIILRPCISCSRTKAQMVTCLDKNRIYAEIVLWSRGEIKQIKRPLEQVTCEPMLTSYTPALM